MNFAMKELMSEIKELASRVGKLEKKAGEIEEDGFGINFLPTNTQRQFQELAREISEKKLKPVRAKFDREETFPADFIKEIGQLGFMGVYLPEDYGGLNQGVFALVLVMEEIARICGGAGACFGANALGALPILISGTEEQKKKYLTKIASGEALAAFALTEADAGSDALALKARAVKDGDHYILNGSKQFITNAGVGDIYSVFAKTNPNKGARGVSGFILEKGTPGLEFGRKEDKLSIRCSETRTVTFNDCEVPAENLIGGKEGIGAITLLNTINKSRLVVGAQAVGIAQGAFEEALAYAKNRKQFNRKIIEFQAIQHKLANMAVLIEAARNLVYKGAWLVDKSADKDVLASASAKAKYYASEIAGKVTDEALQIFGGNGIMRDYPIEKYWRDARVLRIYEGTSEIQLNEIAQLLIKESAK